MPRRQSKIEVLCVHGLPCVQEFCLLPMSPSLLCRSFSTEGSIISLKGYFCGQNFFWLGFFLAGWWKGGCDWSPQLNALKITVKPPCYILLSLPAPRARSCDWSPQLNAWKTTVQPPCYILLSLSSRTRSRGRGRGRERLWFNETLHAIEKQEE